MSCMTRCFVRYGVLGALALGGVTLLVGPERVAAGLAQIRTKAQCVVDSAMDDPMALRRQLEQLADEYPDRIAEVRGEIAEVNYQIAQFDRDVAIAQRVVAMTTEDLGELGSLVKRAQDEHATSARPVAIRFEGVRYDMEEARTEGHRINSVRGTYQDRLSHDEVQLDFLSQQRGRLSEILGKLESDFSTYQSQLWQLDRQIDAIQRNERLIELTEQQQETLDSYERFGKVGNLKQLEAKLAEIRTIQEAQLATLEKRGIHTDYEKQAIFDLDTKDLDTDDDPFVEISDPFETEDAEPEADGSVAWNSPRVFE